MTRLNLRQAYLPDAAATRIAAARWRVSPLDGLGRSLAGLPQAMKNTLQTLASGPEVVKARVKLQDENSVFELSPGSTVIHALDSIPLPTDQVRFYSIIGNRGRGGPLGESSDGAVPCQSSHLPQVGEIIVPAGHTSILKNPATHAEVVTILREAAKR